LNIIAVREELERKRLFKYLLIQHNIGLTATDIDIVKSPYSDVLDIILGQSDFIKRHSDTYKFCITFTHPGEDLHNDPYWRYCNKTNIKLIPSFLFDLAYTFEMNEDYSKKLLEVCRERGTLSDDGDAWVDKHSGRIIKKVEFNNDEGYDESGFKSISREVMEKDMGDTIIQATIDQASIKSLTPENRAIVNIIQALTGYMGISLDNQREFILRNVSSIIQQGIPSEELYENRSEKMLREKGKALPPYKEMKNSTLIIITLSVLLIAIQINIPSVKTKKTFPGCIRSFSGFPAAGAQEDMTGITYIACVANKIKSGIDPWSALKKMSLSGIMTRMKDIINKYLLPNREIVELIKAKTVYISLNKNDEIPIEHSISRWSTFLPPLKEFRIANLKNVTKDFLSTTGEMLKKGNKEQHIRLDEIQSKIFYFSLEIQSIINKIVGKHDPLLTNAAQEPFLENTCCNDKYGISTIKYFNDINGDILKNNAIITELQYFITDVKHITIAPILYDKNDTKLTFNKLGSVFNETTIYKAFISYCKYNSILPVSQELRQLCSDKPKGFNSTQSLEQQILFLKQEGKTFGKEAFDELLKIVGSKNIIDLQLDMPDVSSIQKLRSLLYVLDEDDSDTVAPALRNNILAILDTYDISITEDTADMRKLKNYLASTNSTMKAKVLDFIKEYSSLSKKKFNGVLKNIDMMLDWEILRDNKYQPDEYTTLDNTITFIRNYILNLTDVFPNIILNEVDYKAINIPRHWNLSDRHSLDIRSYITNYYGKLQKYYKDTDIIPVLQSIQIKVSDMNKLMLYTPFLSSINDGTNIKYSVFNTSTIKLLYEHYMLNVLYEYTIIANDSNIQLSARNIPSAMENINTDIGIGNSTMITEIELVEGGIQTSNKKVCELLLTYIDIMHNAKDYIDVNYDTVMAKILRSKEREKDDITKRKKDLSAEEREIDTTMQQLKLGEQWSVGLQKGLTQYVKGTYDAERDSMDERELLERKLSDTNEIANTDLNIAIMDAEQEAIDQSAEQHEINDLTMLGDDDDFGDNDGDEGY